jgi:hypothetical protein
VDGVGPADPEVPCVLPHPPSVPTPHPDLAARRARALALLLASDDVRRVAHALEQARAQALLSGPAGDALDVLVGAVAGCLRGWSADLSSAAALLVAGP